MDKILIVCLACFFLISETRLVVAQDGILQPRDFLQDLDERRREERLRQGNPDQPAAAQSAEAAEAGTAPSGEKIKINKIVTSESEILSDEDIKSVTDKFEGKTLAVSELSHIVLAFNQLYVERKFRAGFAVIPQQSVAGGVLQIVLIEARIDELVIGGNKIVNAQYLLNRIPLKEGDLLSLEALEKALLKISKGSPSGFRLEAQLAPGEEFATTSVMLTAKEPKRYHISSGVDNFGTEETGEIRIGKSVQINSLTGRDDTLIAGGSWTEGSKAAFVAYNTPLFMTDARLILQGSYSESEVIGGDFATLGLKSESFFVSALIRKPVYVDALWEVNLDIGGELSRSDSESGGIKTRSDIGKVFAGIIFEKFDSRGVTFGDVHAHAFQNNLDTGGEKTNALYAKFTGTLGRQHRIGPAVASARLRWQKTPDIVLPGSEQFQMGGPFSVRAYQNNQFSGDEGFDLQVELRLPVQSLNSSEFAKKHRTFVELIAFADVGAAIPYRATGDKVQRVDFASGIGGGVIVSDLFGFLDLSALIAQPLDDVHVAIHKNNPRALLRAESTFRF